VEPPVSFWSWADRPHGVGAPTPDMHDNYVTFAGGLHQYAACVTVSFIVPWLTDNDDELTVLLYATNTE